MAKAKAEATAADAKVEANGKSTGSKTWTGAILMGPVSIPVAMYAAGRSESIAFKMLHRECRQTVKQVGYFCPCCVEVKVLKDLKYVPQREQAAYELAVSKHKQDPKANPEPAPLQEIICKKGEIVVMHLDDSNQLALDKKIEPTGNKAMIEGEQIVKGFEVAKGNYVVISKEEIETLKPESTAQVVIDTFVPQSQVNPIYFDSSYYLAADEAIKSKSYSLLREGLIRRKVAAIGKVCIRQSENVVFILPHPDGGLVAFTAYLADEIRQIKFQQPLPVSEAETKAVCEFIDAMTDDLDMKQYHDTYRENLARLITAKQKGEAVVAEAPKPKPVQSDNLLEMLTASTALALKKRSKSA